MHTRLERKDARSSLPAPDSDFALVSSALAGERGALDRLVLRLDCVPRILAAKNQRVGKPLEREELRDLAQDVLTLVWSKLPEYRGEAALESWVYPFCVLELLNASRRKEVSRQRSRDLSPEQSVRAEVPLGDEVFGRLYEGLAHLPEAQAACIRLRWFQECSFEDIARRLAIPVSTAKTNCYRGMERLRVLLGPILRKEG